MINRSSAAMTQQISALKNDVADLQQTVDALEVRLHASFLSY